VSVSIGFLLGDDAAAFGIGGFQQGFKVGELPAAKLALKANESLGGFKAQRVLFLRFKVGRKASVRDGRPEMPMMHADEVKQQIAPQRV
jgi:hypothetical protein